MDWVQLAIWIVCLSPIWGTLLWHTWELSIPSPADPGR